MCPYLVPILLERSLSPIEIVLTSSPQSKILFSQPRHIHCFAQLIQCKWHKNTVQCTLYDTRPSFWKLPGAVGKPVNTKLDELLGNFIALFLFTGAMFDREIVSTWWDLLCNLTLLGAHQLRKNTPLYGPWLLKFSEPKIWDPKIYWNFWSMVLGTCNIWELKCWSRDPNWELHLVTQVS